jgi:hypothetical protein
MMLGVGATAVGLYVAATAWARFPLPREQLSVAGHVGPISIDTPLVQEGTGRNQGSYRTQRIALVATGHPLKIYSPARTLWVENTDRIRWGQPLHFLVDPDRGLIYEATTEGRTMLSYDDTVGNLSASARNRLLVGLALLAFAIWQFGTVFQRHRPGRSPNPAAER